MRTQRDLVCLGSSLLVAALVSMAGSWAPAPVWLLTTLAAYTGVWVLVRRLTESVVAVRPAVAAEVSRWEEPVGVIVDVRAGHDSRDDDSDPDAVWTEPGAPESMLAQAARLVIDEQFAGASMLEYRLHLGYRRVSRLLEALHQAGIVGQDHGLYPRAVLFSRAERDSGLRRLADWLRHNPNHPR